VREALSELPHLLTSHLQLTLSALLVGVCVSVPLGVLAARSSRLGPLLLAIAGTIQTIPSLALLALMVPLLAAIGAPSIGYLPAFIALVLYSVLPILRNTVTGLAQVDPALLEAARGVGMNARQSLFWVELPTALPTIIAGVRTATVWTVGAATLATPVGATSLGNYIFAGLQTRNTSSVWIGCASSALLALLLDSLVRMVAAGVEHRRRSLIGIGLGIGAALYAYVAWAALADIHGERRADGITVGAKTFTEQFILANALSHFLQNKTAGHTQIRSSMGSSVLFDALQNGAIDVYVDYSGTIWTTVMKRSDPPSSREHMLKEIASYLREKRGIELVAALGFENTYALAMPKARAQALGIRSISELAPYASDLEIGGDYEFFGRPEWRSLRDRYLLKFRATRTMEGALMYQAVALGEVDVISGTSTDGRIAAFDLKVLDDNQSVIPRYDAIILANQRFAREHPHEIAALSGLRETLDAEGMRQLNLSVDRDGKPPAEAALRLVDLWLRKPSTSPKSLKTSQ